VEVVKVNDSVQKAQASVTAGASGAGNALGSAAGSLARIKEQQMVRGEKIRAAGELEDRRTGADLDQKLLAAGIGAGGQSSADDILARLTGPNPADDVLARLSAPAPAAAPLAIEDASKPAGS
jgi:phage shock protein A